MARDTLYVTNFPKAVGETQLRELFTPFGEVASVQLGKDEKSEQPYALVRMAAERTATIANNSLNGQKVGEYYLAISYPNFDPAKDLLPKQRKALEAIVVELGETEKVPLRELEMIACQCGISFLQGVLSDTFDVEANGGLFYGDPPMRRSKGGVFFYLARFRMSPEIRHVVFSRKGKPPKPADEQGSAPAETTNEIRQA
jgi:RNA recognition motif-containing protein